MIAAKIFTRTIFVENLMQNIFGDLKFSSKVHILRENREKMILGSRSDPLYEGRPSRGAVESFGNTRGHAQDLPSILFRTTNHFLTLSLLFPVRKMTFRYTSSTGFADDLSPARPRRISHSFPEHRKTGIKMALMDA